MRLFSKFLLLLLIAFPAVLIQNSKGIAMAQETEDEAEVESEDEIIDETGTTAGEETTETAETPEEEEEEDDGTLKKSTDASTSILFVEPHDHTNLPAGGLANVLVGFKNSGKADFLVVSLGASFRYPQDFSHVLVNYSSVNLHKVVEPSRQASFDYSFISREDYNGRPVGLVVDLYYQDTEGKMFRDSVFNETIMITDPVEGFDTETFFLYITLAGLALLVIVALQQTVFSSATKRLTSSKPKVEMGTQGNGDIDYDWIPKENLRRKSPRQRGHNSGSELSGSE